MSESLVNDAFRAYQTEAPDSIDVVPPICSLVPLSLSPWKQTPELWPSAHSRTMAECYTPHAHMQITLRMFH